MNKINLGKDLEHFTCSKSRILAYYFGYWYENKSPNENIDKKYLYKIYKYLVEVKPEIQDLFYDNVYYDNILKILNIYFNEEDNDIDVTGKILLFDIKQTLIEKSI